MIANNAAMRPDLMPGLFCYIWHFFINHEKNMRIGTIAPCKIK